MTKMTLALAAALLAGTTMTSVANADAVRVGFGFPLGSFVAHSNQTYSGRDYGRAERPRYVARERQADIAPRKVVKIKRQQPDIAESAPKAPTAPKVQTAKLEGRLDSDPTTTTVIEKEPAEKSDAGSTQDASNSSKTNEVSTAVNTDQNSDNATSANEKTASATDTKHVCRRYLPAIGELADVPCQ